MSPSTSTPPKIAIIGCGISGLTLALGLQAHNIPCKIYEMRPSDVKPGGAINLAPNALRVLDALGVYDIVRDAGFEQKSMELKDAATFQTIKAIPMSDISRYGYNPLRINRDALVGVLASAARTHGIPIHHSHKLTHIDEQSSSVTMSFANGTSATADLVVGTDGIWSKVRRLSFPESPSPRFIGETFFLWPVDLSELRYPEGAKPLVPGQAASMSVPSGRALFVPESLHGSRVYVGVQRNLPELDFAALQALREDRSAIMEALRGEGDHPEPIRSAIEQAAGGENQVFIWQFYTLAMTGGWVSKDGKGRVLLLGDAAHAFPPHGGQGAGMAIEDAGALGTVFGQLARFEDIHEALDVWQKMRRERIEEVSRYVAEVGNSRKPKPVAGEEGVRNPLADLSGLEWLYNWRFDDRFESWKDENKNNN